MRSVCTIESDVISFEHFLTSFAIFQSFTDLFWELNYREIEKNYKMNSGKVETWHGIIISPAYHVQKSREGYSKSWMHFMYKLDNLFRSIRVSDENTSITPAIQNFNNLLQVQTFFVFWCTIQIHVNNFQPFLASFAIFDAFTDLIWELIYREIEKHYKINSKKVETWHGIIISRTWNVQKSRGLRQKMDTLRVQTGQSLSEYQGFERELICYTGTSFF